MSVIIDGGAGVTFPDAVQQTNAVTNTGGDPRYYAARAWVTFDGSTTPPTILSQVNVASVTRSTTGTYDVNFTANMPNANYAVSVMVGGSSGAAFGAWTNSATFTASSFRMFTYAIGASVANNDRVSVAVFG
jgi:hypothetical protein